MDISVLLSYVNVIILGICLCVGFIIKNLIPSDKINGYIPLIVGVLGVLLAFWVFGTITPEILFVGLISGLSSVGAYEAFKNLLASLSNTKE
jgi:hypothetical protein